MKSILLQTTLLLSVLTCWPGAGSSQTTADEPLPFPPDLELRAEDADNRLPRLLERVEPVYPAALAGSGREDEVWVIFVVDPTGAVKRARVGFGLIRECEEAALAAVRSWKFTGGRHGGRDVSTRMTVRFTFKEAPPAR